MITSFFLDRWSLSETTVVIKLLLEGLGDLQVYRSDYIDTPGGAIRGLVTVLRFPAARVWSFYLNVIPKIGETRIPESDVKM